MSRDRGAGIPGETELPLIAGYDMFAFVEEFVDHTLGLYPPTVSESLFVCSGEPVEDSQRYKALSCPALCLSVIKHGIIFVA